jgi:hypothetical protein
MKTRRLLAILFALASSVTFAQTPDAAPSTRADILRLFDVMQIREQMRNVMEQVIQQTKTMSHEAIKNRRPGITAEELARMDAMSEQTMKEFPIEGILDDMIPVYQKHLTKTDVDAMIAFYSTPTGKKILREMPAMTAEGMQAMYPRLQKQMDETMKRVEQMEEQTGKKPSTATQDEKKK